MFDKQVQDTTDCILPLCMDELLTYPVQDFTVIT